MSDPIRDRITELTVESPAITPGSVYVMAAALRAVVDLRDAAQCVWVANGTPEADAAKSALELACARIADALGVTS